MTTERSAQGGEMASPAPDLMVFYDNYKAPLAAGSYRFVLQQTVNVAVATLDDKIERVEKKQREKHIDSPGRTIDKFGEEHHYYRDQRFEVQAPRYTVDSSETQACYPPSGGVADYQNILPHLVLRSRNLPWERSIWSDGKHEPWLALLVLSEQDILDGKAAVKTGTVADLAPQQKTSAAWLRTEGGASILLPQFNRDNDDQQTPLRWLDLDLDVFLKIKPRREELPLLAHIRHVDTTNKVPLDMVADGEFAVLVANRFPQVGGNTVHLISIEGWKDLFDSPAAQSYPASRLRLITLASWSFVCNSDGYHTFGGLMIRLREQAAAFGVSAPKTSDGTVNDALKLGYVPLEYQPLESTPTMAWYRGPLSPQPRQRLQLPSFERADSALIFDERTGIMDVSYAAAWELGRILALASPAFVKGLRLFVEQSHNAVEFARQVESFLELHRSSFPDAGKGNGSRPVDERVAIADELIQWIASLVLLYPLPFHYLVPHALLLPSESMRFFHLDDNWVEALVEGALSIAVRDLTSGQTASARSDLQSAMSQIVYQYRLRLQGKHPEFKPTERYMDVPKSGFLLRSTIVTGWPGVEVTATTSAEHSDVIPEILRLDQIADGVLFCLARGSLKQVTFREPREGITFGVDSEGAIKARKSGKTFEIKKQFQRSEAGAGVTEVGSLRRKLAEAEGAEIGPAALALQMIRMPEEQVIEWA